MCGCLVLWWWFRCRSRFRFLLFYFVLGILDFVLVLRFLVFGFELLPCLFGAVLLFVFAFRVWCVDFRDIRRAGIGGLGGRLRGVLRRGRCCWL